MSTGSGRSRGTKSGAPRWRVWTIRLLTLVVLLVAGYSATIFGQVWWLKSHAPRTTAFMQRGLARLRENDRSARLDYRWVPYGRIGIELKRAVIAAEDQRFLEHGGFDIEAMHDAYERNSRRGRVRQGGSTISQQLAKNLFLSPNRTYLRKAQEALITVILEQVLGKRRIFEIYLNVIEWGRGIYGAEAAAQHYFGKPADDLDADEAARLAAMIPSPRRYTDNPDTPYLDERTHALEDLLDDARVP